jgi:hypothetical protein
MNLLAPCKAGKLLTSIATIRLSSGTQCGEVLLSQIGRQIDETPPSPSTDTGIRNDSSLYGVLRADSNLPQSIITRKERFSYAEGGRTSRHLGLDCCVTVARGGVAHQHSEKCTTR